MCIMCSSLVYHILQFSDFMLVICVLPTLDTMHVRSAECLGKAGLQRFDVVRLYKCHKI